MRIQEFLTEEKWCQGWYARDEHGNEVHWKSFEASTYSLMGVMHYLYPPSKYQAVQDRYASLIRIVHKKRIEEFNDSATWEEVKFIVDSIEA